VTAPVGARVDPLADWSAVKDRS